MVRLMNQKTKFLFIAFLGIQMVMVAPVIAEQVTGIGSGEISLEQSLLVIDSLQTQEPPGIIPEKESMVTSYYGREFHGRRTASGEPYDRFAMTCAHKTLPFNTLLKVTNPRNGKSVIVRVTDRGPFLNGRQLDLSYGAAQEIDMLAAGVIRVDVLIYPPETKLSDIQQVSEKDVASLK